MGNTSDNTLSAALLLLCQQQTCSSNFEKRLSTFPRTMAIRLFLRIWLISSVHHSVVSNSLWPHGLQHARLPCPSPTPGAYTNSCPLSQWCCPTISSSVVPFSSRLQSFLASGSFLKSQLFVSCGQIIGVLASASVLPMNIQDWFPFGIISLISLQSKGFSRVFSKTTIQKHQFFSAQLYL